MRFLRATHGCLHYLVACGLFAYLFGGLREGAKHVLLAYSADMAVSIVIDSKAVHHRRPYGLIGSSPSSFYAPTVSLLFSIRSFKQVSYFPTEAKCKRERRGGGNIFFLMNAISTVVRAIFGCRLFTVRLSYQQSVLHDTADLSTGSV